MYDLLYIDGKILTNRGTVGKFYKRSRHTEPF
ncbi:uncharacterized protein METZ01_LOCUS467840, partial [marine metagenome]